MIANWRGTIGWIKPTARGRTVSFWYRALPDGIECMPSILGFTSGFRESFDADLHYAKVRGAAGLLCAAGAELIVVSGSPPFIMQGHTAEERWRVRLSGEIGVPVVTGMAPHVTAAVALGAKHVAVATYYGDELNEGIAANFQARGVSSSSLEGYEGAAGAEGLYSNSLLDMSKVGPDQVYDHCRRGVRRLQGVDALYINGGGWDVAPVVAQLEEDLAIPVIWAIAAEMWMTLSVLGVRTPVLGYGALLVSKALRDAALGAAVVGDA